jgi:hypothetical protein
MFLVLSSVRLVFWILIQGVVQLVSTADPAFWTRFGVHFGLFIGALRGGATAGQMSRSGWRR